MRSCIYFMMVSLDGYIEDQNKSIDWILIDEELHRYVNTRESEVDVYLLGRRMFELMNAYWPTADLDPANPDVIIEFARIWKSMPKMVFSRTLKELQAENTLLVKEDVVQVIKHLKQQPGKNISIGGADLARTCIEAGVVDEYHLYINPVILGGGTPMLPLLSEPIALELVENHVFSNGVVFLRYRKKA
ncbi:MAG: dihydrofolate reductase family protein [Anaerolineae bacterium]|nr:dihydrofolate reductase family protein [Anaerolineae bacterium]